MSEQTSRPRPVIGPTGEPLALDDLPPPNLKRWIVRRKAEVVAAVRAGLIDLDDACTRYGITTEEFLSWRRLLDEHGLHGLRATRLQAYRRPVQGDGVADAQPAGEIQRQNTRNRRRIASAESRLTPGGSRPG